MRISSVALCLALAATACIPDATKTEITNVRHDAQTGSVGGLVFDFVAGTPMAGVTVTLYTGKGPLTAMTDAQGFYAFSIICPHEGFDVDFNGSACPVSPTNSTSTTGNLTCCSGHGGTFNGQGVVTHGPPTSNLTHYLVTVASSTVSVNTATTVAVTARTLA